ncbi:MAG TPA: ABC transporter permease [Bryobacteraceae bacterium]|nr:ABC transporter permease [Bryobacteraceae bacterium]
MTPLWQDIVYGFRILVKKPGFTIVAALSLALGIGANTVIFSLINTTLLRPLPYPDSGRLVMIWSVPLDRKDQLNGVMAVNYMAFRQRARSFAAMGALRNNVCNVGVDEHGQTPERVDCENFTPSLFQALGVKPVLGRVLAEDENPIDTQAPVLLISTRFWQRRFNGDPGVIGKTMRVDGVVKTVIGVMPPNFYVFDDQADFWTPVNWTRTEVQSTLYNMGVVARLRPGVPLAQAQAEMDTLAAQLAISDPERNKKQGAVVQTMTQSLYGQLRSPLLLLQGAVGIVLLIGCANVAGLLLARAASRRTEIAVRTAIGAGRGRIVRQLITESLPLSLLGGMLGGVLAWGGLRLFVAAAPPRFPRLNELSLDLPVLAFTALVAILTAVLFGIAPAIQASNPDLVGSLKESGRSGTEGVARQHLRSALVTVQIAMALILLIGAGLMINSFIRIANNQPGADPKGLLTFEFGFSRDEAIKPYGRYRNAGLWDINPVTTLTFQRIFERVQKLPGIQSAAGAGTPPLAGALRMGFLIEGRPAPPPGPNGQPGQMAAYIAVTPNYFPTLRTPIVQGRDFSDRDTASAPWVVVINQTMAKRYWPHESAIGKQIRLDYVPDEPLREIVGVAGDIRMSRQQRQLEPTVYVPYLQQTPRWMGAGYGVRAAMYFILRTSGNPKGLAASIREAVAEVDHNKPVADIRTVQEYLDQQVQYVRLYVLLLGIFGGVAAGLAAIGIYGVMAYSVAERTREIGIRMALGASAPDVLKLVILQALLLLSIGLALGLSGSLALTRYLKSALYEVTATDPATYIGISMLLILVALLACVVPTRRAVSVNPTVALRYE